ncbi:hypothetical protein [Desulfovibrio aminophilus]|uniref:hypothetical protein n=1 Tax=Desulfovibrio aminophilus TaxID=81425 RepID=UPI0004047EC9|nr:hypothetical protein [Desulfovibrio aminophilus]
MNERQRMQRDWDQLKRSRAPKRPPGALNNPWVLLGAVVACLAFLLAVFALIGALGKPAMNGPGTAAAPSPDDVDRLTSYAVILGRAGGCGRDTTREAERVGRWIERRFPEESRAAYFAVVMTGMAREAEAQHRGERPDSCAEVLRVYDSTPWP